MVNAVSGNGGGGWPTAHGSGAAHPGQSHPGQSHPSQAHTGEAHTGLSHPAAATHSAPPAPHPFIPGSKNNALAQISHVEAGNLLRHQDQGRPAACDAPPVGLTAAIDAYAAVGGSVGLTVSVNPHNGQVSLGGDVGAGLGVGVGGRLEAGKTIGVGKATNEALPPVTGGVYLNGTAAAGLVVTGSRQLLGTDPGDWTAGGGISAEAAVNVNTSAHFQFNLPPLYNLHCER